MMTLYDRCECFLMTLGVPVTQFCKRIQLSRTCLYDWRDGKLRLSQATLDRIEGYISRFGF